MGCIVGLVTFRQYELYLLTSVWFLLRPRMLLVQLKAVQLADN
jgi:hypothetical protein